jgi:hypothetical protein
MVSVGPPSAVFASQPSILRSPAEAAAGTPASVSDVQRLAAPSAGRSIVAPLRTVVATPRPDPSEVVQRAVVPSAEIPTRPPLAFDPPAPPVVQRAEAVSRFIGVPTGPEATPEEPTDYRKLAELVWPHIRRQLRVERERERGLPS